MKIEYFNCPQPQEFGNVSLPIDIEFLSYEPDFSAMEAMAEKYTGYKNILIIGHGGSITSFNAIYTALEPKANKAAYILSTVDPDDIAWLKDRLKPEDTLVIAISKSGETVTQLEALSQFWDYPLLFIASQGSTLAQIAKAKGADLVEHPTIGGRYTGFTEVALLPAAICGLDVKSIFEAGRVVHSTFNQENEAWKSASVLVQLEGQGIVDVFMPFYSHRIFGMNGLIIQLCHESFGKEGHGQTYFAHEAPESQHHTNQRFLGGRHNVAGIFVSVDNFSNQSVVNIPEDVQSIVLKNETLGMLNNIPLSDSIAYEMEATLQDAVELKIPAIHMALPQVDEKSIGEFMAFWQLYAVYASILRGANPFDQPAVENSKEISFKKRLSGKI